MNKDGNHIGTTNQIHLAREKRRMLARFVLIIILMQAGIASAEQLGDIVEKALTNSERYYQDLEIPEDVITGKGGEAEAEKVMTIVNSDEYNKKIDKERQRIQSKVFGKTPMTVQTAYGDVKGKEKNRPVLGADERIYIFISSSIPTNTLRAYAQDIEKLGSCNVFMVMRGFKGGMRQMQPTLNFISKALQKDPSCSNLRICPAFGATVEIDPLLFRMYQPEVVPAIVYVKGLNLRDAGHSEGDPFNSNNKNSNVNSFWMMYGDTSISNAMARISEESGIGRLRDIAEYLR